MVMVSGVSAQVMVSDVLHLHLYTFIPNHIPVYAHTGVYQYILLFTPNWNILICLCVHAYGEDVQVLYTMSSGWGKVERARKIVLFLDTVADFVWLLSRTPPDYYEYLSTWVEYDRFRVLSLTLNIDDSASISSTERFQSLNLSDSGKCFTTNLVSMWQ